MGKLSRKRKGSYTKYNDPKHAISNAKAKIDKENAKKNGIYLIMM